MKLAIALEEGARSISTRYKALRDDQEFEKVQRLFAQMSDVKSDRFRAFLSGWTALEIFVNKTFRAYESTFLAPLASAGQPSLREKFLRRLKDVVKDKYRLADKFLVISAVLFPDIASAASESDLKQFSLLKNIRDSLFHGEEVTEANLPDVNDSSTRTVSRAAARPRPPNGRGV